MTIVPTAPTSAEVLSHLDPNDGQNTVLAQVNKGAFVAQIVRYDGHDGDESFTEEPNIVIDCSDQDGGQPFNDLTVLPRNIDTFMETVIETVADYTVLINAIDTEWQDGAFEGEWHRSAGTVGTPTMHVGPEKREVYASTTWQENAAGQITQPLVCVEARPYAPFLPREAMQFAVYLAQEATRAMAVERKSEVVA